MLLLQSTMDGVDGFHGILLLSARKFKISYLKGKSPYERHFGESIED